MSEERLRATPVLRAQSRWVPLLTAALVIAVAGCGTGLTDAEELAGPVWMVVDIDGEPVPFDEVYFWFNSSELTSATLATHIVARGRGRMPRCRESVSDIAMDVDGNALTFDGFDDVPMSDPSTASCAQELADLHDRIALALEENQCWERTSDRLVLSGANQVT